MTIDKNGYRNLIAWQKANTLAHQVYDLTQSFPKDEMFGLVSQMRRAAISIAANIAEGYTRPSKKDRKHFYLIALGSATELEFYIDFAYERRYYDETAHQKISNLESETAKILSGLIKSVIPNP